jgi:polyisoprenoid-binding protein YceI
MMPAGTWEVDATHSTVEFSVRHRGIPNVRGKFTSFQGTLEVGEDVRSGEVRGSVKVASIDTNEQKRDAHLRSADFFDAERYPEIAYESTRIEPIDEESSHLFGNLTMHGVTREIRLGVLLQGTDIDPWGNKRAGLQAHGTLNSAEFGLTENQEPGAGNVLVGEKVRITLDISAVLPTSA